MEQNCIYSTQEASSTQCQEQDIDERIDIDSLCFHYKPPTLPQYSPDLFKYFYMTQLLRVRNKCINSSFQDQLFKESCYESA
jgi:hypothetical protein